MAESPAPDSAPGRGVAEAAGGLRASPRSDALRELQARLTNQLQAAQTQGRGRSWLAVECGDAGLLLPLSEAGEIFPFRGAVAVPHTRPWFLGVTNLRGALHGVVDLGRFLGLAGAAQRAGEGWLVALNPSLDSNCALRVDRLAGLRREDQLHELDADASATDRKRPCFAGASFADDASATRRWQQISLAELASDAHFLSIALPP